MNINFLVPLSCCMALAGCGGASGIDGMPTSLDEHAQLVCDASWSGFEAQVDNATGQEKDILVEQLSSLSKEQICNCTKAIAAMGSVKYDSRGEEGVEQELVHFNVFIGPLSESEELQNVYDTFKEYSYEEAIFAIKNSYDLVTEDLGWIFSSCASGLEPDSRFLVPD